MHAYTTAEDIRTVLVVEDNAISREILSEFIGRSYRVLEAEDGTQALALLRKDPGSVTVVVLDLTLPDMSGWDVLGTMRGDPELAGIPVVVATAHDRDEVELESFERGAADFVRKPFNATIVLRRIDSIVRLIESQQIIERVECDARTDIYSLQAFLGHAPRHLARHEGERMDLVLLTVRHAPALRQRYGDDVMRRVVRLIAGHVEALARGRTLVAQYGDDVVAALLPGRDDAEQAMRDLNAAISREIHADDAHLVVGSYMDVDRSVSVDVMCARARMALDVAVGGAQGAVAFYTDELERRMLEETTLENAFSEALVGGQFEIWFQPKCSPADGRIVGAEALVRWRRGGELLAPGRFIPCFERSGKVRALDRHVFARTCSVLAGWRAAGIPCVPVSVNLSRRTIRDDSIADCLLALARRCGLSSSMLPVEITETATEDEETVAALGGKLREAGFSLHMDDFGVGSSSLACLSRTHFETIKIDRNLVVGLGTADGDAMMRHTVLMARALGLRVVAEGVETASQAEFLRDVGVDAIQGYYFSRPVPAADFEAMLAADAPLREVDPGLDQYRSVSVDDVLGALVGIDMGDSAMRSLAGAIGRCVLHDGEVVLKRATPAALDLLGIGPDEALERPARSLSLMVVPEERKALLSFFAERTPDEVGQAVFRLRRRKTVVQVRALRASRAEGCEDFLVRFSKKRVPVVDDRPSAGPKAACETVAESSPALPGRAVGLGRLHGIGIAAAVLLAVVTLAELSSYAARYGEVRTLYERYGVLRTASADLTEASAMLTESARLFVQTRDRRYMDAYFHEANGVRRREKAVDTVRLVLGDGPALAQLRSALAESVDLMGTALHSMRLACEALGIPREQMPEEVADSPLTSSDRGLPPADKLRIAGDLLSGPGYQESRNSIDSRSRNCIETIWQEIDGRIRMLRDRLTKTMDRIMVEVLVLSVLLAVLSGSLFSMVLGPLRRMRAAVACGVESPVEGSDEMRMLAGTYNRLLRERKEAQRRLRHEAEHDALTGVLNRGSFTRLLEIYEGGREPFALILVDVDLFKQVNDTEGHEAGDRVLRRVASVLEKTFRRCDLTFRIGGDEFCVVMTSMTRDLAPVIQEKIRSIGRRVGAALEDTPGVTLSVGVAFSGAALPGETLFGNADKALYRVKETGRNGCAFFSRELDAPDGAGA